jgi:hypothetical protein
MIGNGAGTRVTTGTERTARSHAGRMHLADQLPDGFTDAELDRTVREAGVGAGTGLARARPR